MNPIFTQGYDNFDVAIRDACGYRKPYCVVNGRTEKTPIKDFYNAGGADPVSAIANAVGSLAGLGSAGVANRANNAKVQMNQRIKSECGRKPIFRRNRIRWDACANRVRNKIISETQNNIEISNAERIARINAINTDTQRKSQTTENTLLIGGIALAGVTIVVIGAIMVTKYKNQNLTV